MHSSYCELMQFNPYEIAHSSCMFAVNKSSKLPSLWTLEYLTETLGKIDKT